MCTKGHILLEALDRPGCSQLQVNELKKLVETTNPIPKSPVVPTPPSVVIVPESPLSSDSDTF